MEKRKKLLVQTGLRVIAFFLMITAALCFILYTGCTAMYLNAKDEMIDRDLKRISTEVIQIPEMNEVFALWAEYPDQFNAPYDDYYSLELENSIADLDGFTFSKFHDYTDEQKMYAAQVLYVTVMSWIKYESEMFDYERIYVMDIGDKHPGLVYFLGPPEELAEEPSEDAAEGTAEDGAAVTTAVTTADPAEAAPEETEEGTEEETEPGLHYDITPEQHPAIKKIRSGIYNATEYEVAPGADGRVMYIGYAPLEMKGRTDKVVCIEYDWSSFRQSLLDNLILMALIVLGIMLIAGAMLIGYLARTAVRPAVRIQRGVREYIKSKESARVIADMNMITANNELGTLAEDVSDLVAELDEHISKLQDSGNSMRELTVEVMGALAHTIDAKDKYTNGHSERVAIYSRMIAKQMGLPLEQQEKIYYMGLLHDIGKIGIPREIINKTSKLTDEEYALIRSHTTMGYDILKDIESMPELAEAARWHHELLDGTGYPDGKIGEDIPFLVRIIAVADSYDAMTSNRSYRQYLPQDVARAEIAKNSGKQFDPAVAECMLKIIDEDKYYFLHE